MAEISLAEVTKSFRSAMGETAGSFRKAANDNNAVIGKITKDLSKMFSQQRAAMSALNDNIEEVAQHSQQTSIKVDKLSTILSESVTVQSQMLGELKKISSGISILDNSMNQMQNSISGLGNNTVTGWLSKLFTLFQLAQTGINTIAVGISAFAGADMIRKQLSGQDSVVTGGSGGQSTSYTSTEKNAKEAADRYAGRTLSDNEWKELVKATHAEAGQKSQTESAMVMASIINRARDKNKSIEQVLREPNQFQAVTGTKYNPGPSSAFAQGPGEKRAEQIYGAAANILEKVSKQQKDFTAASSAAYGAGTNIGYRNKMLSAGGSVVGASIFNTSAPSLDNSKTSTDSSNTQSPVTPGMVAPGAPGMPATGEQGGAGGHGGHSHGGIISGAKEQPEQQSEKQSGGGWLTTLSTKSGKSYQVATQYAEKFKGFVNELENNGYKINSIGGYANRNIAGTNKKSWHAKGMAIDINPSDNPVTYRGQPGAGKTNLPGNIGSIAAKYGLGWGGNWKNKLDTMHFSFGPNEGGSGSNDSSIGTESDTGTTPSTGGGGQVTPGSTPMSSGGGGGSGGEQQAPDTSAAIQSMTGMSTESLTSAATALAAGGTMGGMMGGTGNFVGASASLMGGGMSAGSLLSLLGPMLNNTMPEQTSGDAQMLQSLSQTSETAQQLNKTAMVNQAEQQVNAEKAAQSAVQKSQDDVNAYNANRKEGFPVAFDYNHPDDHRWPDWVHNTQYRGYRELDPIKTA